MAPRPIFTSRLNNNAAVRRAVLLDDLDHFMLLQRVRVAENLHQHDLRVEEERWASGAWEGRDRLELSEVRR